MRQQMEQEEMHFNDTTPNISPVNPTPGFPAYGVLVPLLLLTLVGCAVAVAVYIRRKARLDELRHRLIPLYTYDPAEEDNWRDDDREDEDEELAEPLYKKGTLSFSPDYRT